MTADEVSEALAEQGLPIEPIVAYTAETDVNNLMGGVEVFDDEAGATARSFIQTALQGAGGVLGTEYGYVSGGGLLRVSGLLTPEQAATYEVALGELGLGGVTAVRLSTETA